MNFNITNATCNFTISNTICNQSYNNVSWPNTTFQPTSPTTKSSHECYNSEVTKIVCCILYSLLFIIGVLGNSVVLYVIGYRKKRRTTSDIFIISLACADFLSSAFYPIWYLSDLLTNCQTWLFGPVMCYITQLLIITSLPASAWSLVFISLDRYRIIAKPLSPRRSLWCTTPFVAFIWLISFAICFPHMLMYDETCKPQFNAMITPKVNLASTAIWYLFVSIIPTVIIGVVYWLAFRALKRNTVEHANDQAVLKRNKENAKIFKMFLMIIIIFIVLTMPSSTMYFTVTTLGYFKVSHSSSSGVYLVIMLMIASNGCVNPFIYAKMQKEIRHFLRVLASPVLRLSTMSAYRSRRSGAPPTGTSLLEAGVDARSENGNRANSPPGSDNKDCI